MRIQEAFYSGKEQSEKLGARASFEKSEAIDAVIVTDGIVAAEALSACDAVRENGVRAGVILLEKIKPFGECADNIMRLLPNRVKKIVFLEEEIRAGGMGMLISDEMRRRGMLLGIAVDIIAVDDTFVNRHAGKTMYEDAGVCAEDIAKALMR